MIITAEQIRAALGALNWSRKTLSEKSGATPRTIQRMAEVDGIPSTNAKTLSVIIQTLEEGSEKGYIEFTNTEAPGIKYHKKYQSTSK